MVPKGNRFLPSLELIQIINLYKQEQNAKAKIRLQACIERKKGRTLDQISEKVHYPLTTVGDWLRRMHKQGIERRYSIKQTGRPAWLNKKQKKELKSVLDKSPEKEGIPFRIWTTKCMAYYISEKYNVLYKLRNLEYLVHELGFNFKKPRQEHKKANKEAQEKFKKKFEKRLGPTWKLGGKSYSLMKASSQ